MKKIDKKILQDLYESVDGLFAFTFYSRYKIEPELIFTFIENYKSKGIVEFEEGRIFLTTVGKEIILKQVFFQTNTNSKFGNIPKEFIGNKIEINEPYLPNIKNVSAEIIKKKKVE